MDPPKCHYHPQHNITTICLHSQCILPLCEICFQIHKKEHPHGDHLSRVTPLKQAKAIAISAINNEIQGLAQAKDDFDKVFNEFRSVVKEQLNNILEETYMKLKAQKFPYDELIQRYDPKIKNVQQNLLEELINHYEYGNVFMNPKRNFYFIETEFELRKFINSSFFIKQENNDEKQGSLWDSSVVKQTPNFFSLIGNQNKNKRDLIEQKENDHSFGCTSLTAKRKSRQGIFVASSSRQQRCYSTDFKKHHTGQNQQDMQMRATNKSLHKSDLNVTNEKKLSSPLNKSKLYKVGTRSQSEKHFSDTNCNILFPDKVLIYKQSTSRKRLNFNKLSDTKDDEKAPKDINNVINKTRLAQNRSSKLITKRTDQVGLQYLNPQQMRDLIASKRERPVEQTTAYQILNIKTKL